ncbi:hypothetical protein [Pandoraea terrigena]|uniref:Uncharacterized protein n=1 Tax=Pandoraea terrigena TaxID=2508292 RepID=A0A5E4VJI4_9BURK|nr:hypothetical protein [Pandoraea terrigena]VVE12371.1 hypothetical protein PTE31013_02722 [Pandoraea terrigena]
MLHASDTTLATSGLNDAERREPVTPLAEDFARAQQAAAHTGLTAESPPVLMMMTHACPSPGAGSPRGLAALAPLPVTRASSAPAAPSRPSTVDAPTFTIDTYAGPGASRALRIFDALWQEIALPALDALGPPNAENGWRTPLTPLARPGFNTPQVPGGMTTQPWHETLQTHLHRQARTLALHGFDVADVSERLEALLCEQRPVFSWRAFCIGTLRDALPFATGSTFASLLAEATDPTRSQAPLWPPLAALAIVLINLLGMASFNVTQRQYRNRIARTTPAPGLEGLSAILSTPYRAAFAQVLGFVFCYGVLRNGARYGIERGVSHWFPGIFTRRFGDTLHAALEIPLAPIPGMTLLPIIHQLGTTRHNASLQILAQDNLAELLIDTARRESVPREWHDCLHEFVHDVGAMLRSAPPRLIWFALTATFYYLAWMGDGSAHGHGRENALLSNDSTTALNATQSAPGSDAPSLVEDAHVFAVLDVLYGLIGLVFSIGHSAAQREDIRTAHERRAPRPKISTITVITMADSGVSSASSMSMRPISPNGVGTGELNNNWLASPTLAIAASPAAGGRHVDDGGASRRPAGARRHGTTTLPGALSPPHRHPRWPSAASNASDDSDGESPETTAL